jgi:hypothetical protein
MSKIRKVENLHIVFWLIKDSCWMFELKWLGVLMIIPTLMIAIYIIHETKKSKELYINLAILFWIIANSLWMYTEFFDYKEYKLYASIPFFMGFVFVGTYFINIFSLSKRIQHQKNTTKLD